MCCQAALAAPVSKYIERGGNMALVTRLGPVPVEIACGTLLEDLF